MRLNEFASGDSGGGSKFIPWKNFIEQLKEILAKDFDVKESIIKDTIKAKFIPHDPMEFGPTMLYSYYERRAGRDGGAISTRGAIQVGQYFPSTRAGESQLLTGFSILKGHPFERHFDLTFENLYKIANIIKGNTKGAYQMQSQGVTEDTQSEDVDQITRDFVQHYENDPMGVFMHAKSSYLDAVGKAKHFSRKAAALYKSHANMSKQEFQDTVMKYFGKHLQNNGFPSHASEGWGKAEHELVKELINLDNQGVAEGILDEVSSNWEERIKAQERIADLVQSRENWQDHPIDDVNEMKKLVKIVGRATVIYDSDNYRKLGTAGKLLDLMTHYYNQKQIQSGTLPQFDSAVASSQYFARQIAMHTNGTYNHRYARVWTTSHGQRYKDPSDYVEYNSKDDLNSAWQWIESKGKKVYYYDHFKHLNTAVKIGKFIVEPASYTARAFSDSPETVHAVSVRSAAVINKSVRRQVDISDQQANALKDIAATKNKNALEGIKLIMSILQGEQDVKSVIDNSKKLDSNVKAKLDAIIAGAANFKEPDQGVTEGEIVKGTFGQKFKPNLGRTVQTSPYEHRPDIDIPQYDPVRKTNWIKGISKENNKEPYDHFELDQTKPNIAHIIGVTKDGLQVKISTSNLKLAEILVDLYNRGGFTDADIEKIPMKSPEREKPKLKLVKSDDIEEDTTSPSEKVEAYGYVYNNRDQRIVWRKIFSSEDEANRWADRRNATVLGIKPLKPSDKISETSAGSVATVVNPKMKDRSKVGTLFGGTYKQRKDK